VVRQLQTFGKDIEGRRVPVQLRYLTRDVLRIISEAFPKTIEVESYIPDDLWMVPGDAMQLHQLLMNLCVNARDAMPQGGTLKLTLEPVQLDEQFIQATPDAKTGPYVLVTVSDTGTGITTENLDLIFDPFFTTKESGQGSGLGLSTALGIVRRHGGFIQVDSQPGHGSRFKVYLPAEPGPAAERRDSRHTEDLQGRGEIILVVDDEEEVRKVTKATLEKNGYQVLTAGDGTEALAVYAQNQAVVKAVITDLMMPYMDGPSTIHALRKLNPDLPILAASGRGAMAKISDLEALHVPKVLAKPFTGETLLRAMRNLLRPETK
jgi:CheY-like chemotaxis protein